ncbi:MAG: hypothetical protein J6B72_04745 [Clostridia bacterium]|nr:hypothetical protein [Clostridia bacterium]
MKKLLIAVLTCFLIFGLCACANNEGNDGDETSATTANTTENTSGGEVEPELETKTYTLNSSTFGTRWFGEREYTDRFYATCNYPGSGFESKIKCSGGKLSVKFMADGECAFLIYLDGELQKSSGGKSFFFVTNNLIELDNVPAGEHTLRFIRATEFGAYVEFCTITLAGELLPADGADAERNFIEFIGDGVDSKVDVMDKSGRVGESYPYLVANQLNVDYSITSYRRCGLVATEETAEYLYGEAFTGNFARKADIAVINVGAFDVQAGNVSVNAFKSAYRELIAKVKQVNGDDCKIAVVWTSGNTDYEKAIVSLCQEFGGENAGYFVKVLTASADVPPSADEHSAYATALVEFINEVKSFVPKSIATEQNGTGGSISFDSDEWANF